MKMEKGRWVTVRYERNERNGQYRISVWKIDHNYELAFTLEGHDDCVNSVSFRADHLQLASCSDDKSVKIWSLESGQELGVLNHESKVADVEFSKAGDRLISSTGRIVLVWSLEGEPRILSCITVATSDIFPVALFNPVNENEVFVSGRINGEIGVWNIGQDMCMATNATPAEVVCMSVSPVGSRVACFFRNNTGAIIDFQLDTSVALAVGDGNDACFDGAGERLAVTEGSDIIILNAASAEPLLVIDCTKGSLDHKNRNLVLNIGWDATSNNIFATLWYRSVVFDSATGDILAVEEIRSSCYCRVRDIHHQMVLL